MAAHRDLLRSYFREVARDLIGRGAIRRTRGEAVDHIIAREWRTVAAEVKEDFAVVMAELGVVGAFGVAQMAGSAVQKGAEELLEVGVRKLAEIIGGGKK